ncbi:MAG: tripeptide aminopeptidase PepT, partial [Spirochaetales bacterium]
MWGSRSTDSTAKLWNIRCCRRCNTTSLRVDLLPKTLHDPPMNLTDTAGLEKELLERFLRYAKIFTTSDDHVDKVPSTPGQWDLLKLLERELTGLGVADINLTENGYLIGRIPAGGPPKKGVPVIGLMAHVDTSEEAPGENVNPQIHPNYGGGIIQLKEGYSLDPAKIPHLASYKGKTIITSDGTTLLGADDKAGLAIIMTAVHMLIKHPEYPHCPLEIIFNADEETARGTKYFPKDQVKASFVYTLDGDREGSLEAECFNAHKAVV